MRHQYGTPPKPRPCVPMGFVKHKKNCAAKTKEISVDLKYMIPREQMWPSRYTGAKLRELRKENGVGTPLWKLVYRRRRFLESVSAQISP